MKGQRVGYVRVSTEDQNPSRQLDGREVDRLFVDRASGRDATRPELERMLAYVREGDALVVHSMDRLARNLDDLRRLVRELTARGIRVEFVKEGLTFTGDDSPIATLLLSVMGAIAEFERALIRERQSEGIRLARKRGAFKGRRRVLAPLEVIAVAARIDAGEPAAAVARELGIGRTTLFRYLRAYRAANAENAPNREADARKLAAFNSQIAAAEARGRAAAQAEIAELKE